MPQMMASATVRLYKVNSATGAYEVQAGGGPLGCVIFGSGKNPLHTSPIPPVLYVRFLLALMIVSEIIVIISHYQVCRTRSWSTTHSARPRQPCL